MSQRLQERINEWIEREWPEYKDHLVAGTTPSLVLDYIKRDLKAILNEETINSVVYTANDPNASWNNPK